MAYNRTRYGVLAARKRRPQAACRLWAHRIQQGGHSTDAVPIGQRAKCGFRLGPRHWRRLFRTFGEAGTAHATCRDFSHPHAGEQRRGPLSCPCTSPRSRGWRTAPRRASQEKEGQVQSCCTGVIHGTSPPVVSLAARSASPPLGYACPWRSALPWRRPDSPWPFHVPSPQGDRIFNCQQYQQVLPWSTTQERGIRALSNR